MIHDGRMESKMPGGEKMCYREGCGNGLPCRNYSYGGRLDPQVGIRWGSGLHEGTAYSTTEQTYYHARTPACTQHGAVAKEGADIQSGDAML